MIDYWIVVCCCVFLFFLIFWLPPLFCHVVFINFSSSSFFCPFTLLLLWMIWKQQGSFPGTTCLVWASYKSNPQRTEEKSTLCTILQSARTKSRLKVIEHEWRTTNKGCSAGRRSVKAETTASNNSKASSGGKVAGSQTLAMKEKKRNPYLPPR